MAKPKYEEWLTEDGLLKLEAWARNGLTDEQIAANMGVSAVSLWKYKTDHISIFNALKRGKEVVDIQVENALFKRAIGYEYTEECMTKEGVVRLKKYAHPDTTAQIFWLKNRNPKAWRDKQELEHSGEQSIKINFAIPRPGEE